MNIIKKLINSYILHKYNQFTIVTEESMASAVPGVVSESSWDVLSKFVTANGWIINVLLGWPNINKKKFTLNNSFIS